MHGWQCESTDGPKGGGSCAFWSGCSGHLNHKCWMQCGVVQCIVVVVVVGVVLQGKCSFSCSLCCSSCSSCYNSFCSCSCSLVSCSCSVVCCSGVQRSGVAAVVVVSLLLLLQQQQQQQQQWCAVTHPMVGIQTSWAYKSQHVSIYNQTFLHGACVSSVRNPLSSSTGGLMRMFIFDHNQDQLKKQRTTIHRDDGYLAKSPMFNGYSNI